MFHSLYRNQSRLESHNCAPPPRLALYIDINDKYFIVIAFLWTD